MTTRLALSWVRTQLDLAKSMKVSWGAWTPADEVAYDATLTLLADQGCTCGERGACAYCTFVEQSRGLGTPSPFEMGGL